MLLLVTGVTDTAWFKIGSCQLDVTPDSLKPTAVCTMFDQARETWPMGHAAVNAASAANALPLEPWLEPGFAF